ncbi:vascular endothelial growth factor receptor 1 isoform X2 [Denticeps clupeoides]|uniref:vascular endothelial growth factor receptor 1 isoform X2 n=1 Tax=Denticeps clupeoides TaxID=299321 RepID=UPI0010A3010E|nr:vascular endothelial growth factor receptor 1 isoform X2 [Denticeps clupeoides]
MIGTLLLLILCGMLGCTLGKESKGKFSTPVLDVSEQQLVLEANQTLRLKCRGRWELLWALPSGVTKENQTLRVDESRCGKRETQHCSTLVLSHAKARHTGSFRCRYRHKQQKQAAVYVYVRDSQRPFVRVQKESPELMFLKEGEPLIFPCKVTWPDAVVSLIKWQAPIQTLIPDQKNIIWNSRQGFIIRSPSIVHTGLFSCEIKVNGVKHLQHYITHRPVNEILEVYLNSTRPVQTLQGGRLALNCTVTAPLNSRVTISWSYPGTANITKRIMPGKSQIMFYSILSISHLRKSDRGAYTCHVRNGPVHRETNTTVIVYDEPFLRLKHRQGSVLHASAGQKYYRLTPKLRAFPPAEVIWLKDGMVAAEKCSRYHAEGSSLVIRDVAEEDAGVYTVLTGIQQFGLYRNITYSLVVNVRPQIGEKAVSVQDPGTVQRGSRQALRCTTYGVPPPKIQWFWHPCPPKRKCEQPGASSRWTNVAEQTTATSTDNPVLSMGQKREWLQGRNKTVGVLTVAEAAVSGVYRCVASNSVGKDELDIRFYVTDVPDGFMVSLKEEPTEGGDLNLSCTANRHLYSELSWHRLPDVSVTTPIGPALGGEVAWGEFSNTLHLSLSNLTAGHSGTYRCSGHHLLTGELTHREARVDVTVLEAPVLMQNLSDCSVNVSSSVTLMCLAHGVPRPLITWYKDQQRLKEMSGIMLALRGETLHIDRITTDDQGLYTCQATNERGSVESSAYISVESSAESLSMEIPTLACTCVVATLFWLLITLLIRKLKQQNSSAGKTEYLSIVLDPGEGSLARQCERLQFDPSQWEFPRDRLKLEKPLGEGAFGKVMQASAFGINNATGCTTVAVKMLKEGATPSEHKALMTELKILNHIGHHLNVVNLLGACTRAGGPLMVIVEYCRHGNLSAYLKSKREVFFLTTVTTVRGRQYGGKRPLVITSSNQSSTSSGFEEEIEDNSVNPISPSETPLLLEDLISYSFQVAKGMEFLASRKCIHRDLAARNILLSDNNVVKICDFGLARDVYRNPDYVRKGDARLPLKWMSPESIFDKVFTTQSDVWSFGVLLWEIFSLGASPYPGLNIDEEFCHRLKQGTRMRAPEYSTPEIYSTMLACWEQNPADRPTFTGLVKTLGDLLQAQVQQDGKDYIPLSASFSDDGEFTWQDYKDASQRGYINTRRTETITTFEEDPHRENSDDNQTDSGMVLPSEELKRLRWSDKIHSDSLSKFFRLHSCQQDVGSSSVLPCVNGSPRGCRENRHPIIPCDSDSEDSYSPPPEYNLSFHYPSF